MAAPSPLCQRPQDLVWLPQAQLAHPPVRQALGLNKMGSPPSGTDITANKGGEVVPLLPAMPMEYWDPSQSVSGAEGDSAR